MVFFLVLQRLYIFLIVQSLDPSLFFSLEEYKRANRLTKSRASLSNLKVVWVILLTFTKTYMDQEEKKKSVDVEQAVLSAMSDPKYWARRRNKWEEWGSPVGLGLGWALFIIPVGVFLWLLHLAGILH